MRTVTEFGNDVRVWENIFIPMRDGARLAARVWTPVDAETRPVPAVLEYIPYRKRDVARVRDALHHPYFAGHGYASVRVDLRGSGDSDGVLTDEYRPIEQDDAVDVIAWLSQQSWCDGNVGMMGISWGGFNSLQVAARRPPALKAIISASATEDLYVDNMHYMSGCLLTDNLSEATVMLDFNSMPPDPAIVGERWREMWQERLEGSGLWLDTWLRHQRRDDYWKPASVCENYSDIHCPVFAVGGWADGYTNAIFRLLEHLDVPRTALIGPWGHKYPHLGVPGPAIGFLQESLRWWDHWLKGKDTGFMDEPMLRCYVQDSVVPASSHDQRPGRWIGEPSWPSPNISDERMVLSPHGLHWGTAVEVDREPIPIQSPLTVGMFGGKWASYAATPDLPSDQRQDDGGSVVFDSGVLDELVEIVGRPSVELEVSSDKPVAMLAVRLSDVRPDGSVERITYGVLNLTHRTGSAEPQPLQPGENYRVEVSLNGIAARVPAGHRLRLSLSTSYWPLVWPSPEEATVTLFTGTSTLRLPTRPPRAASDEADPVFAEPAAAAPVETTTMLESTRRAHIVRDLDTGEVTLERVNDQGKFRIEETGTCVRRATEERFSIRDGEVNSARGETTTVTRLERDDWRTEVVTRTILTSTPTDFVINAQLDAVELDDDHGDRRVHSESWHRVIPRDLV